MCKETMMIIRLSEAADFEPTLAIINEAASAYRGVIPEDGWHEPYMTEKPILIGTWAAASWAVEFYRRNGFTVVPSGLKDDLLRTYWSIPARQIETSVVLVNRRGMEALASS